MVGVPTSSQWLAFVIASALFIQVPGPSLLFTIGRALTVGRREALLSVVGNALGLSGSASRRSGPAALQVALLGSVFAVMALCSDSVWALGAGKARDWFARRPHRLDRLSASGGAMMSALGVTLATSE
jgi:threonine/homoserine/homoserine lactone efflux protein